MDACSDKNSQPSFHNLTRPSTEPPTHCNKQLPVAAALYNQPWSRGAVHALASSYIRLVLMGGKRHVKCQVVALGQALRELGVE